MGSCGDGKSSPNFQDSSELWCSTLENVGDSGHVQNEVMMNRIHMTESWNKLFWIGYRCGRLPDWLANVWSKFGPDRAGKEDPFFLIQSPSPSASCLQKQNPSSNEQFIFASSEHRNKIIIIIISSSSIILFYSTATEKNSNFIGGWNWDAM